MLSILESGEVGTTLCPVFDPDHLNYFFVGRPAYKSKDCAQSDYWLLPIVFALKPPLAIKPKRIFPFDSGAFSAGLFGDEFFDFSLEDFAIPSEYANIRKVIDSFFGSNERYIALKPKSKDEVTAEFSLQSTGFPIAALARIFNKPHSAEFDDRNAAIEVQYDVDVPVTSTSALGVVLAEDWLDDPAVEAALTSLGCPIKTYPVYPIRRESYYSKIYELCQEIFYVP